MTVNAKQPNPYIIDIMKKMKDGWTLKYDTSESPVPKTYLVLEEEVKPLTNWALSEMWSSGFLNCDGRYPIASYELSKHGKNILKLI